MLKEGMNTLQYLLTKKFNA